MVISECVMCGKEIKRNGYNKGRFCSLLCKGKWQENQKPVSKEWLYQKYVIEQNSTFQIAEIVQRNPKRVWEWLVSFGIETRKRNWSTEQNTKAYHNKEWLQNAYVVEKRSAAEIANEFGVTEGNILHFLRKHQIKRRTMEENRQYRHWNGGEGEKNGMYGRTGSKSPRWLGGVTPERQAVYSSPEWAKAISVVWQRDDSRCKRCGKEHSASYRLHVHHIVNFATVELRCDPENLVLLCIACHNFVHSKKNILKEFVKEGGISVHTA